MGSPKQELGGSIRIGMPLRKPKRDTHACHVAQPGCQNLLSKPQCAGGDAGSPGVSLGQSLHVCAISSQGLFFLGESVKLLSRLEQVTGELWRGSARKMWGSDS